jgi:hypothetical protein
LDETVARRFWTALNHLSDEFGHEIARKVNEVLAGLEKAVVDALAGNEEAMRVIARTLKKGVPHEWVKKALSRTDIFTSNYTREHFLEDLGKVADVDGLDAVFAEKRLRGSGPGLASPRTSDAKGALLELQTAAKYTEDTEIIAFRQGLNGGEVDIRLKGNIFVECQVGDAVTPYKDGLKAAALGKKGASKVVFVFGENANVPESWLRGMKENAGGVTVEVRRIIIENGIKRWEVIPIL